MTPNFTVPIDPNVCPFSEQIPNSPDLDAILNMGIESSKSLNLPRIVTSQSMDSFCEKPSVKELPTSTSNCSIKSLKRENQENSDDMKNDVQETKRFKSDEKCPSSDILQNCETLNSDTLNSGPLNSDTPNPEKSTPETDIPEEKKLTYREREEQHEKMVHAENPEFDLKTKKVLKEFLPKDLEPLPAGWTQVKHRSNFNLYLHKTTQVVTWSRPYFLGRAQVKAHHIPLTSVPCMFKARLDAQNVQFEEMSANNDKNETTDNTVIDKTSGAELVSPFEFRQYLVKRFDEEEVNVKIYKDWLPEKFHKQRIIMQRRMNKQQRKSENKAKREKQSLGGGELNTVAAPIDNLINSQDNSQTFSDGEINTDGALTDENTCIEMHDGKTTNKEISTNKSDESGQESGEILSTDAENAKQEEKRKTKLLKKSLTKKSLTKNSPSKCPKPPQNWEQMTEGFSSDDEQQNVPNSSLDSSDFRPPALLQSTVSVKFKDANGVIRTWSNQTTKNPQFVLNDYCTKVFRANPKYIESATKDEKYPWKVLIELPDGKTYGEGVGVKKKFAKETAIVKTLESLIPEYKDRSGESQSKGKLSGGNVGEEFFNHLDITNVKSGEFLQSAGHLSPYQFLEKVLLKQNSLSTGKSAVKPEVMTVPIVFDKKAKKKKFSRDRLEYTVTVGKHTVTGKAENPKIAKNKAAGELLRMLHSNCSPSVTKWGDLLRLYSTKPTESQIKAEQHEKDILALKGVNRTRTKEPNHELLGKLRFLMKEIHGQREKDHQADTSNRHNSMNSSCNQSNNCNTQIPALLNAPKTNSLLSDPTNINQFQSSVSPINISKSSLSALNGSTSSPQIYVHTYFNHAIPAEAVIQPSPMPGERIVTRLPILDL